MIICKEKKFVFIHIPKNSVTAMGKALNKTYKNLQHFRDVERDGINIGIDKMHLYYEVINKFISKNILDKYLKFCIVRNPYNKLYSAWNYRKLNYKLITIEFRYFEKINIFFFFVYYFYSVR